MSGASPVERLDDARAAIAKAASASGRDAGEITLIAISKTQAAEAIVPLLDAGHRVFGENKVQEAEAKWPALCETYSGVELHLVGQLQSNKAEAAVALFDAIHSVDRLSLAQAIAAAAARQGRKPLCFVQVNIGSEPQKGGCAVEGLAQLIAQCGDIGLPVAGLMCLPPAGVEPAPYFALLAELARRHGVTDLSMGMSADFKTAVTIGATHVRVGTALFGERA